uniref:Uncharacterized protein n=1 Tax=viral metagenome TaxID=1070528 RepID=A0A6C0K4F3_9ZZZZ
MGVLLFTKSKIENRKCWRFFKKNKNQKVLFFGDGNGRRAKIAMDGSPFVYQIKNRK